MKALIGLWRIAAALALAAALGACASIPPGAGSNPADPWEVYNRHMFDLNDRVDRVTLKPVARAYEAALPRDLRVCINNVFLNLLEPVNAINNLLQAKPSEAMSDVARLFWNSTAGLLGCFDVAAKAGAPRSNEDFGQTLGRWGFGPGPYFVLPLLGPSSVRDASGRMFDFLGTDPLWYLENIRLRNSLVGWRIVDTRASLLPAERVLDAAGGPIRRAIARRWLRGRPGSRRRRWPGGWPSSRGAGGASAAGDGASRPPGCRRAGSPARGSRRTGRRTAGCAAARPPGCPGSPAVRPCPSRTD